MANDDFQRNDGEQFETSTPCFRTADNPWVPGKHSWDEFILKKGAWKPVEDWATTVSKAERMRRMHHTEWMRDTVASISCKRATCSGIARHSDLVGKDRFQYQADTSPTGPDNIVAEENVDTSIIPVDEPLYSQRGISPLFSDQCSLEELIKKLYVWELDPMEDQFLCLDASTSCH